MHVPVLGPGAGHHLPGHQGCFADTDGGCGGFASARRAFLEVLRFNVLCAGAPRDACANSVRKQLLSVSGVTDVHSLHVWSLNATQALLSVHVTAGGPTCTHPASIRDKSKPCRERFLLCLLRGRRRRTGGARQRDRAPARRVQLLRRHSPGGALKLLVPAYIMFKYFLHFIHKSCIYKESLQKVLRLLEYLSISRHTNKHCSVLHGLNRLLYKS